MLSVHIRGVEERSLGGGELVAASSYLKSAPFDLPAYQFEENTSDKWKKLV